MAGKSNGFSHGVLNLLTAGTMPTTNDVPATTYVALLTTNPAAVEASYTNCTRPNITSYSVGWNALTNDTTSH